MNSGSHYESEKDFTRTKNKEKVLAAGEDEDFSFSSKREKAGRSEP